MARKVSGQDRRGPALLKLTRACLQLLPSSQLNLLANPSFLGGRLVSPTSSHSPRKEEREGEEGGGDGERRTPGRGGEGGGGRGRESFCLYTSAPRWVEVGRQHCTLAAYVSSALPWKSNLTE